MEGRRPLQLGLDIGSTTVKAILVDGHRVVFSDYRRHNADVRGELRNLLDEMSALFPNDEVTACVTGSAGMALAEAMGAAFAQEVVAGTEAVQRLHPEVDVVIELGGEDAKITYLHPTPEQRMNGTCAGGTGAFIDQMATLLQTDPPGLNDLASHHQQLYPIASRCGVFAKSDLQPLINQGAAREDLAASIFAAVATQTIAGLANGRPIRGNVMFLGGPLHFLPELRRAYENLLTRATSFTTPDNAQLYVALGAALVGAQTPAKTMGPAGEELFDEASQNPSPVLIATLGERLARAHVLVEAPRLRPLFLDENEKRSFTQRHARATIPEIPISEASGRCWLGIDAGSTTIKAVVLDSQGRIVFSHYASNEGDPVQAAVEILRRVRSELPEGATIGRACSTGYGEALVKTALSMDEGVVETMAHFRAAEHIQPGVTSVVDIGGQDMKYLKIRDRTVDSISVNEACSAGCGSFLQTFAATMDTDVHSFARLAMESTSPVDLGTRCTVFMNSAVKQAQKEGANVGDISAGLSYSVVRNALYKVIKLKDPSDLGDRVVVQGGTFLNDSVLRAFELLTGREVVRPSVAGLMGAYGAALTAQLHDQGQDSTLAQLADLKDFSVETTRKTCRLCQNHCQMTISTFSNGERNVSGNRCDRGASLERVPKKSELPNMYDWKYKRIFGYRRLTEAKAFRGDIGVPRVLNLYENYPFWFTLLTELGFRVMISGRSDHTLFEAGMESIPSENVCYPAKLVHGHIESLIAKGITTIFYPAVSFEQKEFAGADGSFNCPVVATYPEVVRNNIEQFASSDFKLISPFVNLGNREYLAAHLANAFSDWDIPVNEMQHALDKAWEEDAAVKQEIRDKGQEYLEWMRKRGVRGIVLAGRPYHLDPEVNHGIPELINGLGMGVLSEDAVADGRLERPLRVHDQWTYHSRLYEAAARVGDEPDLQMVQINSFGCGLDAVTADQVQEILEGCGDVHTVLKIDEVSNLGAARIRLRSLEAAVTERESVAAAPTFPQERSPRNAAGGRPRREGDDVPGPTLVTEHIDTMSSTDPAQRAAAEEQKGVAAGHIQPRAIFTKQMRDEGWEVLGPQMAPMQFRLLEHVFQTHGLNLRILEHTSRESMETGLKYVNNDSCYPAVVVIGQLLDEFVSGRSNPDRTAVAITQTGGVCRATNYAALLRKGLRDAGYPQVPVIAMSLQGFEDNPGFSLTAPMIHKGIQSVTLGDMLQTLVLRLRPYEAKSGTTMALYEEWNQRCTDWLTNKGRSDRWHGRWSFKKLVNRCVQAFDAVELRDIPRKPRVGIVGEILVKFHPDANNHAVDIIESEGCEAVLPTLMQFFHKSLAAGEWNQEHLGQSAKLKWAKDAGLWALEKYERPVQQAFARTNGKFEPHRGIREMAERSTDIASMGNQGGEGWYLTAEMVDMIENGCPNIICVQPFACLPNHIVGKGMFRALRNRYAQANIVSVDFDPGASEVNQLNRIKLMLATALQNHDGTSRLNLQEAADIIWDQDPVREAPSCEGCALVELARGPVGGEAQNPVRLGMPMMPAREKVGAPA